MQEGERGRERDMQESTKQINIKEYKEVKVRMHEHMTCKLKNIIGLAQSKPTNTQQFNIVITHLK